MNKMSGFLDICIHEVQGAFIPNRQIFDNTLVAYEMLYTLKKKKRDRKGSFGFKFDMSKAYAKVEWDFLVGMIIKLGFHVDWVILIM